MTRSKIETDLFKACTDYKNIIKMITEDNIFSTRNENLPKIIESYVSFYNQFVQNNNLEFIVPTDNHYFNIISTVHKLYPVNYYNKEIITSKWLMRVCIEESLYFDKIFILIGKNFNFRKWINSYISLLKTYKKNPTLKIIQSLEQDFVWRAHLQNNTRYMKDTISYTKNIVDYNCEINKFYFDRIYFTNNKKKSKYCSLSSDSVTEIIIN